MVIVYVAEIVAILLVGLLLVRLTVLYRASLSHCSGHVSAHVESYIEVTTSNNNTAFITGPLPGNPLRPKPMVSSADAGRILEGYIDDYLSLGEPAPLVIEKRAETSTPPSRNFTERMPVKVIYPAQQEDLSCAVPS